MPSQRLTTFLADVLLLISGTTCLALGCTFLYQENIPAASTGLGVGLALTLAGTVDRFKTIKALGLEATTRELNDKISEAKNILEELKSLAGTSGHTLSLLTARLGRWDTHFTFEESYDLATKIKQTLIRLGCDSIEIRYALLPWINMISKDLARALINETNIALLAEETKLVKLRGELAQPWSPQDPTLLDITNRLSCIYKHKETQETLKTWDIDNIESGIERYITSAPELTQEFKTAQLTKLDSWRIEISDLRQNFVPSSHNRWKEILSND